MGILFECLPVHCKAINSFDDKMELEIGEK